MFEQPPNDSDGSFRAWLARDADLRPPQALYEALTERTARTRRRPGWLVVERWVPMETSARFGAVPKLATVLFALALLVAASAAIGIGSRPSDDRRLPPVTGPAGNGLIAFSRDGDIYVGDPVTGNGEAVVAGPAYDYGPKFAPDGTHIAFMRVDRPADNEDFWTDADIVVVRADGSDERVVTLDRPFGREIVGFEWTPDSRSLVSHHDIPVPGPKVGDYLLDAAGVAKPVRLPYTWGSGGSLRPPEGDRVLGCPSESMVGESLDSCRLLLAEMDRDGTDIVDLGAASGLDEMGYDSVDNATWSPDGSQILFAASTHERGHMHHILVMDADGSDLRLLADVTDDGGGPGAWSPDGTKIALERGVCCEAESDPYWTALVILDAETGTERVLEGTTSPTLSNQDGRFGPFKGWAWSPDGQSILYAPTSSDRLFTVDVASGEATELPWLAERVPETASQALSDSTPSWQRVAVD